MFQLATTKHATKIPEVVPGKFDCGWVLQGDGDDTSEVNIEEETKDTMARFLSGINPDIRDVVEFQEYVELDDLLQKAVQVEQQLKRKIAVRRNSSNNFNQN